MKTAMARAPLIRPWTDDEIGRLEQLLASGLTAREAAFKLRRNVSSVRSKIAKLQVPYREQKRSRGSIVPTRLQNPLLIK
jgi:hypothetical protein